MENCKVEIISDNYCQSVYLTIDGVKKAIYETDSVSSEQYCNYFIDNNYIVIYTTRVVDEDDPYFMTEFRNIKAVYDLRTNELLNLENETKSRIADMYLTSRPFTFDVVLSLLTGKMFTYDKNMVNYFRNYLTSYNEDVSLEEIKNYILKCYPRLNEFMNIKSYLLNERKIIDVFGQGYLSFYAMRQDIKLVDNIERNKTGNFDKKYNLK